MVNYWLPVPIPTGPRCRTAASVVLMLALAACAALERRDTQPEPVALELSHGNYLLDPGSYELVPVQARLPPGQLQLEFLLVRGAINGAPEPDPFRTIPVEPGAGFELRLPAAIPGEVPAFQSADLQIEPADTRVTRLGTFHYHPEYGMFRGGGGFIHQPSGDPMLLVHFSAPARLRGSLQDASGVYRYAVKTPRAGWSWLIVRSGSEGVQEVLRYTGPVDAIEFAVLLPPLLIGDDPD
ncbi:MAG: hypothetical protein R3225_07105 [Halofilum sp. (in: g-proteobacteria)]|nr:hypothetical protein [Halofilum sp. (in: g-proteobacteria)]